MGFKSLYENKQFSHPRLVLPDMLHTQIKQSADVLIIQTVVYDLTVPSGFDNPALL
jgi:hypothetical protein